MLAIVSSLVFVAMELRQANSIGRLEAMNSMAESWNTFGVELATSEYMPNLVQQIYDGNGFNSFDDTEYVRLLLIMHGLGHGWEMRFNQQKLGVLEMGDFSFPRARNPLLASQYHRDIWPRLRGEFSEEFAVFWETRFQLTE